MSGTTFSKVKTLEELEGICDALRTKGKEIVLCHGVFDLVHLGHIRYLNSAKRNGDVLVATLTADAFVRRGPGRPIFNENLRAESLANLQCVDYVAVIHEDSALPGIAAVKPRYYVKGDEYRERDKDVTSRIYDEEEAVAQFGGEIRFTDEITFSSSQLLNSHLDSYEGATRDYLEKLSKKVSVDDIRAVFEKIEQTRVLVIGDAIIDEYCYTSPLGKSAKEIIVTHRYESSENFAGGSLATANHLAQICGKVDLLTVLGDSASFELFIRDRLSKNITPQFVSRSNCVTTTKKRYVDSGSRQKMFQVCFIDDHPLGVQEEDAVLNNLNQLLPQVDLVIVSDFGHGLMTPRIVEKICNDAPAVALNVQTNSANYGFNYVTRYGRADFVCIDEREARLAMHDKHSDLRILVERISEQLDCKQVVVTRGHLGSYSFRPDEGLVSAPALVSQHIDKVGAGDAFFAFTAPMFRQGVSQDLMSFVGNAVGALAVQIVGNREPVQYVDLVKFITRLLKF